MQNRETTNIKRVLVGDASRDCGGVKVRPVSLASMAMLELLGNGCLNQLIGDAGGKVSMYALAEFVWVHAAPQDEVVALVAGGGWDDATSVKRAVLQYAGDIGFDRLSDLVSVMVEEMDAIKAAQVETVKERAGLHSKN